MQTDLIVKILSIAGITIKDPMLNQYGTTEDMKNSQQEKQ